MRKRVLAARDGLDETTRRVASHRIVERVLARKEFLHATGVHCFISLPGEVNTEAIFEACWKLGKATYVPYLDRKVGRLGWARRKPGDVLATGALKVREPTPENRAAVSLEAIDLLLVPGVAFDRNGNRMGYGKGYYDEFFSRLAVNSVVNLRQEKILAGIFPVKIGLAFSVQIVEAVPQDPWDIKMDVILTEFGEIEPDSPS